MACIYSINKHTKCDGYNIFEFESAMLFTELSVYMYVCAHNYMIILNSFCLLNKYKKNI